MRRLFSIVILFFFFSSITNAQDTFEYDGINYSIISEPDESTVFGTVQVIPLEFGHYEDDVVIPNAVKQNNDQFADAYMVVGIAPRAFYGCEDLNSVSIPSSIEFIGEEAFFLSSLRRIEIPYGNLTEISNKAFSRCFLKSIHLPKSVSVIGESAFESSRLESVEADGVVTINRNAFSGCIYLSSVCFTDALVSIGQSAFYNCKRLESLTIPDSIKSIGEEAFAGCEKLTEVVMPNGLKEIKSSAFNRSGLTSIVLPASLSNIETGVFSVCHNLRSVSLPEGVKRIKEFAFSDCQSLHSLFLPESIKLIGKRAFQSCAELEGLYLKSTTPPQVGDDFLGFDSADDYHYTNPKLIIYVPKGYVGAYKKADGWMRYADRIREYDFSKGDISSQQYTVKRIRPQEYESYGGTFFEVQEGIEEIGFGAFYNARNLKVIKLPSTLTKICESAFKGCESLETIVLPSSLKTIEGGAFESCINLKEISIPEGVSSINDYTFSNCINLKTVHLPSSLTSIGECAFEDCRSITSVDFPAGLEHIGEGAFKDCKNLKSLLFSEGLIDIAANAFLRCGIKDVVLPKSLRRLSPLAFSACMELETITIKGDYSSFAKDVFKYNNSELKTIFVPRLPSGKDMEVFGKAIDKVKVL